MRFRLFITIFGLGLTISSVYAKDICPSSPSLDIAVQSAVIQPVFVTDSLQAITHRAETVRPGEADGLTDINFTEEAEVSQSRDKLGCTQYHVQVDLKPAKAVVSMASSISPDSCRFKAVMGHEMHHVRIGQDALDHTASVLQHQLERDLPGAYATYLSKNRGQEVLDDLRSFVVRRADDAVRIVSAEYQAGNERLDVPAEADRLYRECHSTAGDLPRALTP